MGRMATLLETGARSEIKLELVFKRYPIHSINAPMADLLIKRPCLLVQDLARSLTLYQDILGFRLTYQSLADPGSYLYTLFDLPAEATVTFASLDSDMDQRVLALAEVQDFSLPSFPQPTSAIVIQVQGLNQLMLQIETLGLKFFHANHFSTRPGYQFTEQAFIDFDGHRMILYEQKE